MSTYYQPVRYTPGLAWVCLREISGYEEQEIDGIGASVAIRLLDRLLVDAAPLAPRTADTAQQLSLPDRDRLMAGIYSRLYGSKIESTLTCVACKAPYDMDFSLDTLLQHLDGEKENPEITWQDDGSFVTTEGLHLRLPTGADELAVWNLAPAAAAEELMRRCVQAGDVEQQAEQIQEALQQAAPMLATEMAATCPECGHGMTVQFDMQSYLLNALKMEKKRLRLDVHRLASSYKWSLEEILRLPRSARRQYTQLIESEREALYA